MEIAPKKTFLSRPFSIFVPSGGRYSGIAEAVIPGTLRIALK